MMNIYFRLGFDHILDLEGYDHMLFLLALCIPFTIKDWKKVLVLATAFTIGHSATLILSTLEIVNFPTIWVEFLIPVTIIFTALYDILRDVKQHIKIHYLLALIFGLIHGMGFSNFLRSSLFPGEEHKLVWQLLSFNIGIEIGQVLIVLILLLILWGLNKISKDFQYKKKPYYQIVLGVTVIIWSAFMAIGRIPTI